MLNRLKYPSGAKKNRKILGRGKGSGTGQTSGKGNKGQNARSGGGRPPWFEGGQMPLQRRLPKRGFRNRFKREFSVVNLEALEKKFESGSEIDGEALRSKGLVRGRLPLKVLGNGTVTKRFTVRANKFSQSAKEKIEKAGGQAVEV